MDVSENIFGYVFMMDMINYVVWVMFMFWFVLFVFKFNKWIKVDVSFIENSIDEVVVIFESEKEGL